MHADISVWGLAKVRMHLGQPGFSIWKNAHGKSGGVTTCFMHVLLESAKFMHRA